MSIEIRPEFQQDGAFRFEAEGKAIADQIQRIHSYSKKAGIRPLTDFLDNRDMDEAEDEEEWKAARDDWYEASEGLLAVKQLIGTIQADPKAVKLWNKEDPDGLETLMDDLAALAHCLETAVAQGVNFRLELRL